MENTTVFGVRINVETLKKFEKLLREKKLVRNNIVAQLITTYTNAGGKIKLSEEATEKSKKKKA